MSKPQPKPLNRKQQRARTEEVQTIDLINETNQVLTTILDRELPGDGTILLMAKKKDAELVRLRRLLIAERKKNRAIYQNVIPRLKSKAKEVRALRKKLYGKENRVSIKVVAETSGTDYEDFAKSFHKGLREGDPLVNS